MLWTVFTCAIQGNDVNMLVKFGRPTQSFQQNQCLHVRTLRLSMDKHIHANTLLLLDGVCHVLIHLLLIVSITELTLLVGKTSTSDGCSTESGCVAVPQKSSAERNT